MRRQRWRYLARGLRRRLGQRRSCPSCRGTASETIDRKLVYTLERCAGCALLYRFPADTAEETIDFYQRDYEEPGLTTDLPSRPELEQLITHNFQGSGKDFSRVIDMLSLLDVKPGAHILDYGANWGYGTFQLRVAGYLAEGYEISRPRAAFAEKLGLRLHTTLAGVSGPFDVVYSSHVVEHTPDPRAILQMQLGLVRADGYVIGHTPNGSDEYRRRSFRSFHASWGMVHPCLLTEAFLTRQFPGCSCLVTTDDDLAVVGAWNRREHCRGALGGGELLFILRRHAEARVESSRRA